MSHKQSPYVAYYRVSTKKQGESGLSLQDQQEHVTKYINRRGQLVGEFQDIESGSNINRQGLQAAIKCAVKYEAILVVKRLDRLTRDGFKIAAQLDELGIAYIESESPTDTDFIRNVKLSFAKEEREKLKKRVKDGLKQAKKNIEKNGYHISKSGNKLTSLGKPENLGGEDATKKATESRKKKANNNPNNIRAKAVIRTLHEQGWGNYKIFKYLNENGFKTSRGNEFTWASVNKLLNR